jgi:hypothetical protein
MDSSDRPPDDVEAVLAWARERVAAMNRTADELADAATDAAQARRRLLDDLALELGR